MEDSMRLAALSLSVLLVLQSGAAQVKSVTHPIEESTARKNILKHPDAVYPPIAKAARVQGTVEIAVVIDATGKVTWEKALSGPEMLQQAALDAVHQWTFKSFRVNGVSVPVSATFQIPFQIDKPGEGPTKEQQEAAQAWFPVSDKCRSALQSSNRDDSLDYCKQSLDLAIKAGLTNSSDQIGLMLSHQYYGHALLIAGNLSEALDQENQAVEETRQWRKDTDQESAMPYFWRAMVEAQLGKIDATFADLEISEETHRRAIAHLPEMKKSYSGFLASILRQHAVFLDQLGRTDEANKLRAEAAGLSSVVENTNQK